MSRTIESLRIDVIDNVALKSVIFSDKSAVICSPIHNVDGANPNSEKLVLIRRGLRLESEIQGVPFFYVNSDLANEAIRQKLASGLLLKEN